MPYAANGQLSRKPIEGGIEISEEEYAAAREDAMKGKRIVVEGKKLKRLSNEKRKVYSTSDGSPKEIYVDDKVPSEHTETERPSKHHSFKNGTWVEDEQAALEDWRATASVSARQGMEQLIRAGLDEEVDAKIDAIEDPLQRKLTRNWVDKAEVWERNNAQFIELGEALGLTDEQIDDLFKQASEL